MLIVWFVKCFFICKFLNYNKIKRKNLIKKQFLQIVSNKFKQLRIKNKFNEIFKDNISCTTNNL